MDFGKIKKEVFKWGFEIGREVGRMNKEINPNIDESETFESWEYAFIQDADFANSILPTIRKLAGCKDSLEVGTYTDCTEEDLERVNELLDVFWDGISEGFSKGFREG